MGIHDLQMVCHLILLLNKDIQNPTLLREVISVQSITFYTFSIDNNNYAKVKGLPCERSYIYTGNVMVM